MKKILFIYPETYLNIGIPGGIAIMSALLKQRNHKVDLFDTAFLKTKEYAKTEEVHGGVGLSDKGGVCMHKKTEYTLQDLVLDDPVVDLKEELQKKIDSFNPDIIALSCMTSNFDFAGPLSEIVLLGNAAIRSSLLKRSPRSNVFIGKKQLLYDSKNMVSKKIQSLILSRPQRN